MNGSRSAALSGPRFAGCAVLLIACGAWTIAGAADDRGQRVYQDKCSTCHGAEGGGGKGPKLVPFVWSYERALDMIRRPECDMPPIPESELSDEDVAELVKYLKSLTSR